MICQCNQRSLSCRWNRSNAHANRGVHLAFRIRVYNADNTQMIYPRKKLLRSIAPHYHNTLDATFAQIFDAALDNGLFAEGKQRLERAHPF